MGRWLPVTLQVPRCPARRPTTAPSAPRAGRLEEAGSYLNVGSEENGGQRLSAGETGSRSCALAPFPGERGWEGGSGERREGEREEGRRAAAAGSFLCPAPGFQRRAGSGQGESGRAAAPGWARSSPGLALRGVPLPGLPPSPRAGAAP